MFQTYKNYLIATGVLIILLLFSFIGGCQHGKKIKKCPTIITGTTIIHDTIPHYIPDYKPWYIQGKDSIVHDTIPREIDTAAILQDYFDKHIYARKWENDSVKILLNDTITRNKPVGNDFHYIIKLPFMTINNSIDNSITYQKYLYLGAALPVFPFKSNTISNINYLSIEAVYASQKGYIRVNWQPYIKIYSVGVGARLFQFKK